MLPRLTINGRDFSKPILYFGITALVAATTISQCTEKKETKPLRGLYQSNQHAETIEQRLQPTPRRDYQR